MLTELKGEAKKKKKLFKVIADSIPVFYFPLYFTVATIKFTIRIIDCAFKEVTPPYLEFPCHICPPSCPSQLGSRSYQ